jgi:hypothetical protein
MTRANLTRAARWRAGTLALLLALGAAVTAGPAWAWYDLDAQPAGGTPPPNGIFQLDGDYVMNVGELHVNITNWGLIGSHFSRTTRYSDAPSAQWPAGSGMEYLYAAGLWVGGVLLGERLVSTGQYEIEILATEEIEDTIYEAISGQLMRPPGNTDASGRRAPEANDDDDEDGLVDEEVLNGYDDDDDFLVDEDFGQIGTQMMVCTMYDNTRLSQEINPDHTPLNVQVRQQSYAWENDQVDDFVAFEFFIRNIGVTDISNVYVGFFADADIGPRDQGAIAEDDMGGSWEGLVRASDGSFVPVNIGYMYDFSESGRLPGYFGIQFLGHDTDPTGNRAPTRVGMRSFQLFSGQQPFDQGGDPTNDAERYELLSFAGRDNDSAVGKQNDYRFLISAGPFKTLEPDDVLQFQAALVVGPGLEGLRQNCAEAYLTWFGNFYDADGDTATGRRGRETLVCQEDFGADAFNNFVPDYMDTSCVSQEVLVGVPRLQDDDKFLYTDPVTGQIKTCAYVNMDNCFECSRQNGRFCTKENELYQTWNCWNPDVLDSEKRGCTGVEGKELQIHWLVGMAPPPPGMRIWPSDNAVHVFWDNRSEVTADIRLNQIDFESYRIWRADNWDRPFGTSLENGPPSDLWQMIAEFDLVNSYIRERRVGGVIYSDTIPLGANTGLDVVNYAPRVLDIERNPVFAELSDSMQVVVDADYTGSMKQLPSIKDSSGRILPQFMPLARWAAYETALDTFFAVASRPEDLEADPPIIGKDATHYYQYVDRDIHNGFIYFYSVTATDHEVDALRRVRGAGLVGDPGSSFTNTSPGAVSQTAEEREKFGINIYVYPNPATRDALEEFQQLNPNSDDPTGVRIVFANLPRAHNRISIFTLDGDLVIELDHDGTTGYGEKAWNLVSRNGQEIVSGIYLYSVEADDSRFEDYVGKFVVIR